jgi:uncharacterized protein YjbJ (UPF0337 family)
VFNALTLVVLTVCLLVDPPRVRTALDRQASVPRRPDGTVATRLPSTRAPTAWRVPEEEDAMSLADKASNKAEELKGKGKEATGRATDDDELKAEGKTDQAKGNLKQAGEKVKDVFK